MSSSLKINLAVQAESFKVPIPGNQGEVVRQDSPKMVGRRLKAVRLHFGMTQGQIAEIVGVTHKSTISNWEKGRAKPDIDTASPLVERFGLTLDYIFLGRTDSLRHGLAVELAETESRISTK